MTITFKDERGHECTLALIGSTQGGYVRDATLADLLRALGLSTEGGPTDEELDAIEKHFEQTYTGTLAGQLREIRRAQVAAGAASRQAEVDRLTARVAQLEALDIRVEKLTEWEQNLRARETDKFRELNELIDQLDKLNRDPLDRVRQLVADRNEEMARANTAESELTATKEKLAEVERGRDRARRVVEAAHNIAFHSDEHAGMRDIDVVSCRASAGEVRALREALASAGTDAGRTEAQTGDCSHRWLALPYEVEAIPFCFPPNRKGDSSCAEPTRPEAAESEDVVGKFDAIRSELKEQGVRIRASEWLEPTEEPKPEPQPRDESDPIAWLLRHDSADVRCATAEGIWQAESVAHLPALRAAAEREKVPRVRDYMLHAAGLLEASAPERQPEVKRDDGQP